MKIEKGQILVGTNPYTKQKEYFKYIGKTSGMIYNSGFKRELKQKGRSGTIMVTDAWAREWGLKPYVKPSV